MHKADAGILTPALHFHPVIYCTSQTSLCAPLMQEIFYDYALTSIHTP
jgi:hypothetical protein